MIPAGLFRGFVRGARRIPMTSKRGSKGFYKGRGAKSTGRHTNKGGYVIEHHKIPQLVVPSLEGFKLKPYVSYKTPYVVGKPLTAQELLEITSPREEPAADLKGTS